MVVWFGLSCMKTEQVSDGQMDVDQGYRLIFHAEERRRDIASEESSRKSKSEIKFLLIQVKG